MMEACGAPAELLLQQPWIPVRVDGSLLLAKSWFGEREYHLLLTDLQCVWEERMDSAAIQRRAQELNRRLTAPIRAFFSHLCEVVKPCLTGNDELLRGSDAQISLVRHDDKKLSVKLKSDLAGLPFYWDFHCTPAPSSVVCVQLVRPLLAMSHLLQRQVEQLGDLLLSKDAEIQDYRENGATLSRERLQTVVFEEQQYREDFIAKALPHLSSDASAFDADLQQLYTAIVSHGNKHSLKRRRPDEEDEEEEEEKLPAEEPKLETCPGGSQRAEAEGGEQSHGSQVKPDAAKMADRAAAKQAPSISSVPAERPAPKPKKKKVGLFR